VLAKPGTGVAFAGRDFPGRKVYSWLAPMEERHGNWGELCYGLQANFLKSCGQLMDNHRISRRDLMQNVAIFNLELQSSPP